MAPPDDTPMAAPAYAEIDMAIIPLPLKADFRAIAGKAAGKIGDPTAAARARRYRHRKRDAQANSVTVDNPNRPSRWTPSR